MRITCWYCHKNVTNELPDDTIFRGIAVCPECVENNMGEKVKEAELSAVPE
jgi:hypothetical protein